jgi:hypothetical protein
MDILTVKHMPIVSYENPLGVDANEVVEGVFKDLGNERISYGHYTHSLLRYFILFRQNPYWFNSATFLGQISGL